MTTLATGDLADLRATAVDFAMEDGRSAAATDTQPKSANVR